MQTEVYNIKNEKIEDISLPDNIFNIAWNPDLVHFATVVQLANRRNNVAHAKDRSEVKATNRKPWRQKGTGRARHGSMASPIWVGGGVAHGPLSIKDYTKDINDKQRRQALFIALSKRLADGQLKIIDSLSLANKKTKDFKNIIKTLYTEVKKNSLTIVASSKNNISRGVRGLEGIESISAKSLNAMDVLKRKDLLIEKEAVNEIIKHYNPTKEKVTV